MSQPWSSEDLFRLFVLQQQDMVMVYLGKIANPATGQVERNLDAARFGIDLLGMMEEKTKGNLSADEEKFIGRVLTTLRLNFVEEARRPAPEGGSESRKEPERSEPGSGTERSEPERSEPEPGKAESRREEDPAEATGPGSPE